MQFNKKTYFYILLGLIVLLLPLIFKQVYIQHVFIMMLLAIVIGTSWNLLAWCGIVSLGHAAFYGLGAYSLGIAMANFDLPLLVAFLIVILVAVISAIIVGGATLKMKGPYVAIATLAFAETLRVTATQLEDLTGGTFGLAIDAIYGSSKVGAYYSILFLTVAAVVVAIIIRNSRMYYAFTAIRRDEAVANMSGVPVVFYKITALCISAVIVAMAGAFYMTYMAYLEPNIVFSAGISIQAQIIAIAGGLYIIRGPIIGGVVIVAVSEVLRVFLGQVNDLAYGIALVLIILLIPDGLYSLANRTNKANKFFRTLIKSKPEIVK